MISLTSNRTRVNDLSNGISVGACFIAAPTSLHITPECVQEELNHLKPEAIIHFADELVKTALPMGVHVPVLVTFGQKEAYMAKRALVN